MRLHAKTNTALSEDIFSPVFCEIPYELPRKIYQKLKAKNSCLLESHKGSEHIAQYSFIGIEPYLIFSVKDRVVEIEFDGKKTISTRNPLERLRELVFSYQQKPMRDLPPFQGGALGMLSYDFVRYLERIPKTTMDDLKIPDAHFIMVDRLIAFDHIKKKSWILVCPGVRSTALGYSTLTKKKEHYIEDANSVLEAIHKKVTAAKTDAGDGKAGMANVALTYETEKAEYMTMVEKAKEYIAAGDIYQANLSLRISADIGHTDPWKIYTILSDINPSPFASYVDFGDYQIASSSPERLVRVRNNIVDTRPIAGTRPRGRDVHQDEKMRSELLLNEKERAEHIMLIDLERNDLGKVSDYGTVNVNELMTTEDYSHVIHIVSNVQGELVQGKDCFHVIKSVFPGGTITGVPKVRCMEIIDELEKTSRGPYTGSIGYIGFNGDMDMNIIIRTFLVKQGRAYMQAGAGIVADSDPEREYYESLKKAEALMRTLEYL
ncbi:MAG: anthranilate synthase component I family protein [Nitrospiraceae bacterium]|jgi:aminodeoxychorismate synthase component I|nr:MAG: anthranilate synthase component I family protein [Nitrospiraceae bacterium]